MGNAEPLDLTGKVNGDEHFIELTLEAVLRTLGQLHRLDPEIGRKGQGVFTAELSHTPHFLPGPYLTSRKCSVEAGNSGAGTK